MQATTPEDNSFFFPKRKRRAASGGTRTRDVLRSRHHVHPSQLVGTNIIGFGGIAVIMLSSYECDAMFFQ